MMNHVYTMALKSQSPDVVKSFEAYIQIQFGCAVQIFRVDGETSLGGDFTE